MKKKKITPNEKKVTMGVKDKGEYDKFFLIKYKSNTFILASWEVKLLKQQRGDEQ